MTSRPTLIIVSGPAGSGKTTLAHQLARTIGCPAICRDEIKEGMAAATAGFVPSTSDPLSQRTYRVFFAVIELLLQAEVTLVAEAAFQHRLWVQGLEPLAGLAGFRILRCRTGAVEASRRMKQRMVAQPTRTAHADAEHLAAAPPFDPIHLDAPTLDVDTTEGYRPDLTAVAGFCR